MSHLLVAFAFLGINFYVYNYFATDAEIPERKSFEEFPMQLEDWTCRPEKMDEEIEKQLGVTDYLICDYRNQKKGWNATFYVGYHESQVREEGGGSKENSIHPPAHCLPGSGWDIVRDETVEFEIPGVPQQKARIKRLKIAKGDHRQLVYYWYQSRGRVIAHDWEKILRVGMDRATRNRTDGSLVRFTVPVQRENDELADEIFQSLAPSVLSQLPAYVPN